MPELLKSVVGSIIRWALTGLFSALVAKGVITGDQSEALIVWIAGAAAVLVWSLYQKWQAQSTLLAALRLPPGSTETEAKHEAKKGSNSAHLSSWCLLAFVLAGSLAMAGCGEKKTAKHKLAIYTANADAALIALTKSVVRLNEAGRLNPEAAKQIYAIELKVALGVDTIRERAQTGWTKQDAITIVKDLIADIRKAEEIGVVNLTGDTRDRFRKTTFFIIFSLNSIQAIIEATKEPTVPVEEISEAASVKVRATGRGAQSDTTVWTDLVLYLQEAILRGISQSRMTADEAFADGAALSKEVKDLLGSLLAK